MKNLRNKCQISTMLLEALFRIILDKESVWQSASMNLNWELKLISVTGTWYWPGHGSHGSLQWANKAEKFERQWCMRSAFSFHYDEVKCIMAGTAELFYFGRRTRRKCSRRLCSSPASFYNGPYTLSHVSRSPIITTMMIVVTMVDWDVTDLH